MKLSIKMLINKKLKDRDKINNCKNNYLKLINFRWYKICDILNYVGEEGN